MNRHIRSLLLTMAAVVMTGRLSFAADHTKESPAAVREKVTTKEAVLIDVREQSEWDAGHLRDAILVPLSDLRVAAKKDPERLKQLTGPLPKDKPIYAHCKAGGRCVIAADILIKLGYDVRPLEPGYDELREAGFEQAVDKK